MNRGLEVRSWSGRRGRRAHPPGAVSDRAPALLAAAALGAVLAGVVTVNGSAPDTQPLDVSAAYGLGSGDAAEFAEETDPRRNVALMAASARLDEVQASRAVREAEEAQRRSLPLRGRLTTAFTMRWGEMHWGIDIAAPMMTPEYAAAAGTVLEAGPASGYGNVVYIQHLNGDVTVYGHMEEVLVETGQQVESGQLIARVGSRGFSTGPHLHFEVWAGGLDGRRVDPIDWLAEQGITL
ncbi:M23 family metallopeptidase [Blastococcus sp. CT_GayMR16]|uniref:M23 family metallopeptidase n=1 Tax=Blastococcus sp. CT_GayMR16 TaxID=2559607 RepID=UPI0010737F34|nr:M23 family metallopeptidase [Blastococcus sp. CT_GayMR16]TFV91133.1 M23 family metallopeptidase [Blastococcus sp. CT_GayMR16]